jgi:hypothetical protein
MIEAMRLDPIMEVIDALEQAHFSRSGKPTDNAYVESASAGTGSWIWTAPAKRLKNGGAEYNEVRPHRAIGDRTPSSLIPSASTARRGTHHAEDSQLKWSNFWDAPKLTWKEASSLVQGWGAVQGEAVSS